MTSSYICRYWLVGRRCRRAVHPSGDLHVHGEAAEVFHSGNNDRQAAVRHQLPRGPPNRPVASTLARARKHIVRQAALRHQLPRGTSGWQTCSSPRARAHTRKHRLSSVWKYHRHSGRSCNTVKLLYRWGCGSVHKVKRPIPKVIRLFSETD